jgi:DNA polymerase III epsilon subunit-like protein
LTKHALVFDTETTGKPLYGKDNPAAGKNQPRMCAISMALVEEETGDVAERLDTLVKPNGWPLDNPEFVAEMKRCEEDVHHLSYDMLVKGGMPIADVYKAWKMMYRDADYLCAFNISFDHKIVRGEWERLGWPIPFRDRKWFCLMHASARLLYPGSKVLRIKAKTACPKILGYEHLDNHKCSDDLDFNLGLYRHFAEHGLIELEDHPQAKDKKPYEEAATA